MAVINGRRTTVMGKRGKPRPPGKPASAMSWRAWSGSKAAPMAGPGQPGDRGDLFPDQSIDLSSLPVPEELADNGFAMLWNWNLLGPGPHTVRVFADGMEFDSATFEVNTLGEEFVRGLDLRTELTALDLEKNIEIRWSDSRQGFVISEVREADITVAAILAVLGGTWSGTWSSPTAGAPPVSGSARNSRSTGTPSRGR